MTLMPLFGHTETGYALDVWEHPDRASYVAWASHTPGHALWVIEELPPGTTAGATPDGHGGWVNPGAGTPDPEPEPIPDPIPLALTRDAFLDHLKKNDGDLQLALKNWPLG